MTDWLMIAVGVVLTVGTALFVAGEFSLVALDPSTVETRAATGDKRATVVQRALGRLSTLLSGAQVGITLTTVLLGYTMQAALALVLTRDTLVGCVDCWGFSDSACFLPSGCLHQTQEIAFDLVGSAIP